MNVPTRRAVPAIGLAMLLAACGSTVPASAPATSASATPPVASATPEPTPAPPTDAPSEPPTGSVLPWTQLALPDEFSGVTVDLLLSTPSRWFALGGTPSEDVIISSEDGVEWTAFELPVTAFPEDVAEIDGTFVAVAWQYETQDDTLAAIFTSTDGETWEEAEFSGRGPGFTLSGVEVVDDRFVVVGNGETEPYPALAWISSDGVTWAEETIAEAGSVFGSALMADGQIATVGYGLDGPVLWHSADGETWTQKLLRHIDEEFVGDHVAVSGDRLAAYVEFCDEDGNNCEGTISVSEDLSAWEEASGDYDGEVIALTGTASGWLGREGVDDGDVLWTSSDGETWERGEEPEFGENKFFTVGYRDGTAMAAVRGNIRSEGIWVATLDE